MKISSIIYTNQSLEGVDHNKPFYLNTKSPKLIATPWTLVIGANLLLVCNWKERNLFPQKILKLPNSIIEASKHLEEGVCYPTDFIFIPKYRDDLWADLRILLPNLVKEEVEVEESKPIVEITETNSPVAVLSAIDEIIPLDFVADESKMKKVYEFYLSIGESHEIADERIQAAHADEYQTALTKLGLFKLQYEEYTENLLLTRSSKEHEIPFEASHKTTFDFLRKIPEINSEERLLQILVMIHPSANSTLISHNETKKKHTEVVSDIQLFTQKYADIFEKCLKLEKVDSFIM